MIGPTEGGLPVPIATVVRCRQTGAHRHFRAPVPSLCHSPPSILAARVASGCRHTFAFSGSVQKFLMHLLGSGDGWQSGTTTGPLGSFTELLCSANKKGAGKRKVAKTAKALLQGCHASWDDGGLRVRRKLLPLGTP